MVHAWARCARDYFRASDSQPQAYTCTDSVAECHRRSESHSIRIPEPHADRECCAYCTLGRGGTQ